MMVNFLILVLYILTGATIQNQLNVISRKNNYAYSTKQEIMSLALGICFWATLPLYMINNIGILRLTPLVHLGVILITFSICISIFFIDIKHQIIPNGHNLVILTLGLINIVFHSNTANEFLYNLLPGLTLFVLFFLIMILTGSLGGGDVKMVGGLGLFLGFSSIPSFLLISFLTGTMVAILLMVAKKKKRDDMIAFGPFLIIGFVLSLLMSY